VRRAGRTDSNQKEIVDALRKARASVFVTSSLGGGFPDLVIGFRGKNYLMEVKSCQRNEVILTNDELAFLQSWAGQAVVVVDAQEALKAIGAIK